MSELRFYLDENIPLAVAEQLRLSKVDVVTAHSLRRLGDSDLDHLARATQMGRMLCTHDQDFLRMAADGRSHAGIVFAPQAHATIGGWVRALRAVHAQLSSEEAIDRVVYLSLK